MADPDAFFTLRFLKALRIAAEQRCKFFLVAGEQALKEAFKEAAAIASVVPESMQEGAFHRALDVILGGPTRTERQVSARGSSRQRAAHSTRSPKQETLSEDLARRINRTEHPEISESMPVLERSLAILLIAKDLGVDGLSPPRIADILTEKFRVKTYRQHVNEQLSSATKLVDREKVGRGYSYRIMAPGEKRLASFNPEGQTSAIQTKEQKSSRKGRTPKSTRSRKMKAAPKEKSKRSTRGRPGPKAAIQDLINAGFFKDARTMKDIQERLRTKVGHRYKPTDLSPALGRLLRDGQLDRDRNESGKYEYQQS